MCIIGIIGPSGCGKTTLAEYIYDNLFSEHGLITARISFADPLRQILKNSNLFENPWKKRSRDMLIEKITVEDALIGLGEYLRSLWGEDIVIKITEKAVTEKIKRKNYTDCIIIDDVRMPLELEYVRKSQGIIIICNPPADFPKPQKIKQTEQMAWEIVEKNRTELPETWRFCVSRWSHILYASDMRECLAAVVELL